MACAVAHRPDKPHLESKTIEDVCNGYVLGYCEYQEDCPMSASHCVYLIDESAPPPPAPCKCPNVLSLEPRTSQGNTKACFDNDGPGILSSVQDARHDNDQILIQDIQILPTSDEILSRRRPYMPTKAHDQHHHLASGPGRHLDIAFRHLRYESVEPLIDMCYHAMQQLLVSRTQPKLLDYQFRLETAQRRRFSLLRNVAFEELMFHDYKGAMVRVSFDCPRALQGGRIHQSGLFEEGMLCALLGMHHETNELTTTFFQVHLRESTDAMKSRTGNHKRAAVQLTFADRHDTASISRCAAYMQRLIKSSFVLADFPKVLLAGFASHLDRLQKLALDPDFAFASRIAPCDPSAIVPVLPPKYATGLNFQYNLQALRAQRDDKASFTMRPTRQTDANDKFQLLVEELISNTTLDRGQAVALVETLSRDFAMTQGPPGTGKSFLGVAIAQVILDSQNKASPQAILVAAQTNKACDDFLHDLSQKAITKIARLGRASKAEWIKPYFLRELTSKMKLTTMERHTVHVARTQVDHLIRDGLGWAEALSKKTLGWHSLRDHLKKHHTNIYDHFAGLEQIDSDVADLRRTKRYSGFAYEFWASGGDIKDVDALLDVLDALLGKCDASNRSASSNSRFKEQIFAAVKCNTRVETAIARGDHIWSLSFKERQCLITQWIGELDSWKICEGFGEIHRRHQKALSRKQEANQSIDARVLAQQQIIGLTSTGVAQNWELLNSLNLRTIIIEEASQCLESHTICALFSSVEHVILIGDPLQLRPQITQMALSTENSDDYCLDASLFERLMFSMCGFHVSKLNVQRRMHPEIADLSRAGDYDYLVDHELTTHNPPVVGMADRTYWLDHKHEEDQPDPRSPMSDSRSNRFEVEFCTSMVRYLIEHNGYSMGQIVILTPYNGQLAALAVRLRETCSVFLTEKDREALISEDLLPADSKLGCAKTSLDLSNMLRVATVDNFQGEEAKVIIFSAVRSNMKGNVGFLKTRNRINVACSRARDGFYILGNASLIGGVEHWAKIIKVFREKGMMGDSFRACCSRHPERTFQVSKPEQFEQIPACPFICLENLPCGHKCSEKCHPTDMHNDGRVLCSASCEKSLSCGHKCPLKCGDVCGGCTVELPTILLPCGHSYRRTCAEVTANQAFICTLPIKSTKLPCGHCKDVICSEVAQADTCNEQCGTVFPCGHLCLESCISCTLQGAHPVCKSLCGSSLVCGHSCDAICHDGECPPCEAQCSKSCQHHRCEQSCSSICDPCTLICGRGGCAHRKPCSMLCSLPCDTLPCGEPCLKYLSCGKHLCPGLCSETCLMQCTECETGQFPSQHLAQLSCGHTFDVKMLDTRWALKNVYKVDGNGVIECGTVTQLPKLGILRCSDCNEPSRSTTRYELANQLQDLTTTIEHFYSKIGNKLSELHEDYLHSEEVLCLTFRGFTETLKPGPLGGKHNQRAIWVRGNTMLEIQDRATKFRDDVVTPFESNLARLAEFVKNTDILEHIASPFGVRYDLVYFQCRLVSLEDALQMYQHLLKLKAADQHTSIIAQGLRIMIHKQAAGEVVSLGRKIIASQDLHLKRIEVELKIIQVSLHLILKELHVVSGLSVSTCMNDIRELVEGFPDTAGKLLRTFISLQTHVDHGTIPARFARLYTEDTKELGAQFKQHQMGTVQYCLHKHPFSGSMFADCPECGREVAPPIQQPEVNAHKVLDPQAFLDFFKNRGPPTWSKEKGLTWT